MDNVTHTLIGLAAGELIHRSLPDEQNATTGVVRRRLLLISCAVASNFPDLDLVLSPLLPQPLGYLLHHRGHTHTILYAIPQAALMVAILWLVWSRAREALRSSLFARVGLWIATVIGFALHLSLDYLNSYGIHPFHPLDSGWYFGDMMFIIEPFFWAAVGAPLVVMVEKPKVRIPLAALLIGLPALFAYEGFLAWYSVTALAFTMAVLAFVESRYGPKKPTSLIAAGMVMVGFIGVQSYASGLAKRALAHDLQSEAGGYRLHDVAATPLPTNPFCWTFVSVESREEAKSYRLRRGVLSVASFIATESCPLSFFREGESMKSTSGLEIMVSETGDLARLRELHSSNCHFNAWMRFARAPLVTDESAYDLRFQSGRRPNFTTFSFADFASRECPKAVPQWEHPRADLMTESD